jgi:pimeloyl-ACP methyl ester carboxylesterase
LSTADNWLTFPNQWRRLAAVGGHAVEEILFVSGPDGLELAGALFGEPAGTDLIVLTHGGTGRFCTRSYVEIGRELARRGLALLSGDTRGRDIVAVGLVNGEPVGIGGTFERFDESVGDVTAWVEAGCRVRPDRLILAGHSMGGAKAVRALPGSGAAGLLLLAPAVVWPPNPDRVKIAEELVVAGRGGELMPPHPDAPVWNLISAATLHERAAVIETAFRGTGSPWTEVDVPTLVLYGSEDADAEENIALLEAGWTSSQPLVCTIVTRAGHEFRGHENLLATTVVDWLAGLPT